MAEVGGMQIFESPEVAEEAPRARPKQGPGDVDVVESGLSPADAFAKFAGSSFSTSSTDYTDRSGKEQLKRKNFLAQKGDATSFRNKELFEAPAQRRQRLQEQLAEFNKELAGLSGKGDKVSVLLVAEMKKLEDSFNSTCSNPKYKHLLNTNYPLNEDQLAQKNAVAGLSQQLKSFGTDTPKPATSSTTAAKKNATLELYAVAGTSKESASSLSARLDRVEKDLGVFSSEPFSFPDMRVALVHLDRKLVNLSQEKQREAMRRINGLRAELDNIEKQKRTVEGAKPAEDEAKILKLYSMMDRWGKAGEVLPMVVARMQTLRDLEQEGSGALARAQEAKKAKDEIVKLLAEDKEILQKVTKTVQDSVSNIEDTTSKIQAKFDELARKFG